MLQAAHLSSPVTCPTAVAAQGVTVTGTLAAALPCPSSASSSDTASVTIPADPVPVLDVAPTGTTVCAAQHQATVSFDFCQSQHMAPLNTSQFTVQALNSTGAIATGVNCIPTGLLQAGRLIKIDHEAAYCSNARRSQHPRLQSAHYVDPLSLPAVQRPLQDQLLCQ